MIRNSLARVKDSTFSIQLPDKSKRGMPVPRGTGFFISPDGLFITAAHVITTNGKSDGPVRNDISSGWLMKEPAFSGDAGAMCQHLSFELVDPRLDFALLKIDFDKNSDKSWLSDLEDFPFIEVSSRKLDEGEPIYSFGYPLSSSYMFEGEGIFIGGSSLSPRVTSAIISSTLERTRTVMSSRDPEIYVLDKALNYGNSGGPIISTETGKVHAFCSRFQPVFIPQHHIMDEAGKPLKIFTPSLYGIVTSLSNPELLKYLTDRGVSISNS